MELKGEQILALPREQVWAALNDPAVLKQCVPGCDTFEPEGDNAYKVVMTASVGPVKARFNGALTLSDIEPPVSYKLAFTGSGGAAGFGKGSAQVALAEVEAGTSLTYSVQAQVGARLIDGVAKKMADEFFTRFSKVVAAPAESDAHASNPDGTASEASADAPADAAAKPSRWWSRS